MVLRLRPSPPLLPGLTFEPMDLRRLPEIRAMQIGAFRVASARCYDEPEVRAYESYIANAGTADRLKSHDTELALVGGQLVGTAGWAQSGDDGALARLTNLFVDPLFMHLGIGSALAERAERRAQLAGYAKVAVRAPLLLTAFFERLGYELSSYGSFSPKQGIELPIAFLKKPLARPTHREMPLLRLDTVTAHPLPSHA